MVVIYVKSPGHWGMLVGLNHKNNTPAGDPEARTDVRCGSRGGARISSCAFGSDVSAPEGMFRQRSLGLPQPFVDHPPPHLKLKNIREVFLLESKLIWKKILWRINFVLPKFSPNALLFEKLYSVLVKDVTRYMGFWLHLLLTHQTAERTAMK